MFIWYYLINQFKGFTNFAIAALNTMTNIVLQLAHPMSIDYELPIIPYWCLMVIAVDSCSYLPVRFQLICLSMVRQMILALVLDEDFLLRYCYHSCGFVHFGFLVAFRHLDSFCLRIWVLRRPSWTQHCLNRAFEFYFLIPIYHGLNSYYWYLL